MGKKKDCFGSETYVCMTPNCPYAAECVKVVWEKKMDRILAGGDRKRTARSGTRSRSRRLTA